MTTYESLVSQAVYEAQASAKDYVLKMIAALRREIEGITNDRIRDQIEADLGDTWSKRTLRDAFPEEFKNLLMKRPKKSSMTEIAAETAATEEAENEREHLEVTNLIAGSGHEDISIIGQLQGEKEQLERRIEELENGPATPEKSRLVGTMGRKIAFLMENYEIGGRVQCDCGKWLDVIAEVYPERRTGVISKDYFRESRDSR